MKPAIKNAVESALVAFAVGATCLWFLVSEASADEPNVPMVILLSLGLGAGILVHMAWMLVAALRDGRRPWAWGLVLVLSFPLGSIVLLALLIIRPVSLENSAEKRENQGEGATIARTSAK